MTLNNKLINLHQLLSKILIKESDHFGKKLLKHVFNKLNCLLEYLIKMNLDVKKMNNQESQKIT